MDDEGSPMRGQGLHERDAGDPPDAVGEDILLVEDDENDALLIKRALSLDGLPG
jgi:hypothetical protein